MARITIELDTELQSDRTVIANLAAALNFDPNRRPGANVHGLGPDEPNGLNPDYVGCEPQAEAASDDACEVELPVTNTEALNDRPTEARPRIRRTADEQARGLTIEQALEERAARAAEGASPSSGPATPAQESDGQEDEQSGAEAIATPAADAQGGQSEPTATDASPEPEAAGASSVEDDYDDDADAEGLQGVSEAQDALDAESEAIEPGPAELALEQPQSAVTAFINSVGSSPTWNAGKQALADMMKTPDWSTAEPHEQKGARLALWNIPARIRDKVDPASDPTGFICWLEQAPEEDQVDGTLEVLERSDIWINRLQPAQRDKIRAAAQQAKRRIADRAAAE